jgi:hypothetical protein
MRLRYVIVVTDADRFQKDFDSERYRSLTEAVRYSAPTRCGVLQFLKLLPSRAGVIQW